MFVISLDLILGYAGIVSIGHAAYFGLGAYTAGIVSKYGIVEPVILLVLGAAVAGVVGYATSFIIARFRHLALIMITLGICLLLYETANLAGRLTGGADGLQGIKIGPLLGTFKFDLYGKTAYAYSLIVLFLCFLVARRVIHSPFGLSLRGIRENEGRMKSLGFNTWLHCYLIYVISGAFASVAGVVWAYYNGFVSPTYLELAASSELFLMVTLGGPATLIGPVLGAAAIVLLKNVMSAYTARWLFVLGVVYIVAIIGAPQGIWNLGRRRPTDA